MTDREALIKLTEEIQQVKDSHNENGTSINYGTICSLVIIAHRLLEEVRKSDRESCEFRHENGNCLKVGGFCTAVDDKYCEKGGKECG